MRCPALCTRERERRREKNVAVWVLTMRRKGRAAVRDDIVVQHGLLGVLMAVLVSERGREGEEGTHAQYHLKKRKNKSKKKQIRR